MILVDSNIPVYLVGAEHQHKALAVLAQRRPLRCSMAELLHGLGDLTQVWG